MIETKHYWHTFEELEPAENLKVIVSGKSSIVTVGKVEKENDGLFKCTDWYGHTTSFCKDAMWAYLEEPKIKEFHVWLDSVGMDYTICCKTLNTTRRIMEQGDEEIHTTQLSLLRTSLLDEYRVFLHQEGKQIEITLGECQGTERIIKAGDNLEKLVLGGEFSFANIT